MTYGRGHWFHSRVASSKRERESIVKLVEASNMYSGLRWSGSKTAPQNIQFSNEIGVNPSQMQTKIRAFMRFGFIEEGATCPLKWTKIGEIWRSLVLNGGENLRSYTDIVEELIIASSLSLFSFDSNGVAVNPTQNYRPVFDLFQHLDSNGFISNNDIEVLIGVRGASGSNYSYWTTDLKNAGILEEMERGFKLTNKFPELFSAIITAELPTTITDEEWKRIQNNVLDSKNPYLDAILSEMEKITGQVFNIEGSLPFTQKDIITKMVDYTNSKEESEIENQDYNIPDSYGKVKIRRKQSAWSKKVRGDYDYKCCIPECDVEGSDFTEGSHIKKYSEQEEGNGHRANPHNGLCLCLLCHGMFDKGYFTLTNDLRIDVSSKISEIPSSRLKDVIIRSRNRQIKMPHSYNPEQNFLQYHQRNIFKN